MTSDLKDRSGASVTITLEAAWPVSSYVLRLADGTQAGRADFLDAPGVGKERIIFHTEIGREFSGQGLAGLLVREVLEDTIRKDLVVVPVCPLFAAHLEQHGAKFRAGGGLVRQPTRNDFALVKRAMTRDA